MLQKQLISSGSRSMNHYFLCSYLPRKAGNDVLSQSLLRFKSNVKVDVQAWVECSVEELATTVSDPCIVVRALHSTEKLATYTGLDQLGIALSDKINCSYHPEWIIKTRNTKSLKTLRKVDRHTELHDVYRFRQTSNDKQMNYLIIDDILTTGTTAFAIATAIEDVDINAQISVFTLARVDYDTQLNESLSFYSDGYHWEPRAGWQVHEELVEYNQLDALKEKIRKDRF